MDSYDTSTYPYGLNTRRSDLPLVSLPRNSIDPQYNQAMAQRQSNWNMNTLPQQNSSLSVSNITPPQYGSSSSAALVQGNAWGDSNSLNKGGMNSKTNEESKFSCSKLCAKITSSKMLFFLVGLIIAAVPLAVFATLWVNNRSSSSSEDSGTTSTAASSATLPIQCYAYSTLNDITRNQQMGYSCCYSPYDSSLIAGWYRVTGSSGSQIASSPIYTTSICGSSYPGYYNGSLPSKAGTLTTGNACFYTGSYCGYSVSPISVMNCSGYYIFYLVPTSSSSYRYCTTS
ncbi:unnamed protein product [Adineta ricciae]|uniref:Uncharacterized protein n=1 Tax=Adineta ricciae TaxID=249248 RepID=A0A814DJI6_ADIRI|nr:unnamed protein product [Adineta ricciae]CAF1376502.1 unnamed protein product [Adineta ricciae]